MGQVSNSSDWKGRKALTSRPSQGYRVRLCSSWLRILLCNEWRRKAIISNAALSDFLKFEIFVYLDILLSVSSQVHLHCSSSMCVIATDAEEHQYKVNDSKALTLFKFKIKFVDR